MKFHLVAGAALLAFAASTFAHDYQAGSLTIVHPYARATAPSQPTGGGYFKLVNRGASDRLLGASAPVCASVELHSMRLDGDVMRMREVTAIDVPAGKTVELTPGGLHLMLVGLKAPLVAGQSFRMTLKFEKAGAVTVDVKIDAPGGAEAMVHDKRH